MHYENGLTSPELSAKMVYMTTTETPKTQERILDGENLLQYLADDARLMLDAIGNLIATDHYYSAELAGKRMAKRLELLAQLRGAIRLVKEIGEDFTVDSAERQDAWVSLESAICLASNYRRVLS